MPKPDWNHAQTYLKPCPNLPEIMPKPAWNHAQTCLTSCPNLPEVVPKPNCSHAQTYLKIKFEIMPKPTLNHAQTYWNQAQTFSKPCPGLLEIMPKPSWNHAQTYLKAYYLKSCPDLPEIMPQPTWNHAQTANLFEIKPRPTWNHVRTYLKPCPNLLPIWNHAQIYLKSCPNLRMPKPAWLLRSLCSFSALLRQFSSSALLRRSLLLVSVGLKIFASYRGSNPSNTRCTRGRRQNPSFRPRSSRGPDGPIGTCRVCWWKEGARCPAPRAHRRGRGGPRNAHCSWVKAPCRAACRVELNQGSTQRCSWVSSRSCWTLALSCVHNTFCKGSGMVSCLAKRVKYQLLQGETILDHVYALITYIDMFICCTGIGLLGQEQKMTVLANLIIPDIHSQLGKVSTYQFAAHFTYRAVSFRDAGLDKFDPRLCGIKSKKQPKCMQISSKCTYISDAGFYSLLWHNSHFTCASWRQKKQTCKKNKNHALLRWVQR